MKRLLESPDLSLLVVLIAIGIGGAILYSWGEIASRRPHDINRVALLSPRKGIVAGGAISIVSLIVALMVLFRNL